MNKFVSKTTLKTPRVAKKTFVISCKSLRRHQGRFLKILLPYSCYHNFQDSDVGNVCHKNNTNRVPLAGQIKSKSELIKTLTSMGYREDISPLLAELTPVSTKRQAA